MAAQELPVFSDIELAAKRIQGEAVLTPLLENVKLNALTGGRVFIKAECLLFYLFFSTPSRRQVAPVAQTI